MVVPSLRLSLPPLRRIRETVPSVVGIHISWRSCPAVAERPELGTLNGFGLFWAKARRGALRAAMSKERGKSILASNECLFGMSY